MSLDDDGIVINGPSAAEVEVPPDRYAFPARALGPLERMTPVTIGGPGWWIVDELVVSSSETTIVAGRECVEALPSAEWGAAMSRVDEQEGIPEGKTYVRVQHVPVDDVWVYQDAPGGTKRVYEIDPFDPLAWLNRLMDEPTQPPPKRTPRPARELPSLVGRTARWKDPKTDEWVWLKLLSEPLMSGGDYTVAACAPSAYWRAVFRTPAARPWVIQVPLHTLWTY